MKKYRLKVKNTVWMLFAEGTEKKPTGWVTIKVMEKEGLSRTKARTLGLHNALQYIWMSSNQQDMKAFTLEDLENITEEQF